ncbi:MAG: hypothetical protein IPJ65_27375 [Archangiaceae bacterium]|nr:hypothetical protein [Archangiaceae bacterium]
MASNVITTPMSSFALTPYRRTSLGERLVAGGAGQRLAILLLSVFALPAGAQLRPTGGHYPGRASDTGFSVGAGPSGPEASSVPFDFPAERGGMPVPVQLVFGTRGVGAAGLGWDVPLSYVRRDTSIAYRRPKFGSNIAVESRPEVTLVFQGAEYELVPKGPNWVSRAGAPGLLLNEQPDGWRLYDGQGRTYLFTPRGDLGGTGLWLLSSVRGPNNALLASLEYATAKPTTPEGRVVTVDLTRVTYNFVEGSSCPKHEIRLEYLAEFPNALSLSVLENEFLARMHVLTSVEVRASATCGGTFERLRRYVLAYSPDTDTAQPRLADVTLYGREGTQTKAPIASYTYGSALTNQKLVFEKTETLALPSAADLSKIGSTENDLTFDAPYPGIEYASWQGLTDFTGDGRADLIFQQAGRLWMVANRPGASGGTILDDTTQTAPLSGVVLPDGPFEMGSATVNRYTYGNNAQNVDKTWRQAMDANGDGRVDLIDAAEEQGKWVFYFNTPGPTPATVKWERRSVPIAELYHHLRLRGLDVQNDYLPLASRFTARDRTSNVCWRWNGHDWVEYPQGWGNSDGCFGSPADDIYSGEKTFTEWELNDLNADGYPELVFNSSRVALTVVQGIPTGPPGPGTQTLWSQVIWKVGPVAGSANNVDAVLNLRGLIFDSGVNVFSLPLTLVQGSECGVGMWLEDGSTQSAKCTIADVNGDHLPDRVEAKAAYLGTGRGFSQLTLPLPVAMHEQRNAQRRACEPPATASTLFSVKQLTGLKDLTGDGIPDLVSGSSVYVGTGAGFRAAIPIEGTFAISQQIDRCGGGISKTTMGLFDVNGDGRPEVVVANGSGYELHQIKGAGLPGRPEAGRIVAVDNGHGARTTYTYRSAKEDRSTRHQVPFPEIVVTAMETAGTYGLGGRLSATQYAYGDATQFYDPALDRFRMAAYGRTVSLVLTSLAPGKADGVATVTDTYPLPTFSAAPQNERFGRYLKAGRVRDSTVLSGTLDVSPWALLTADVNTDPRRISQTHSELATVLINEPPIANANTFDCFEMVYPYSFINSWGANPGFYDVCSSHGFVYERWTTTSKGQGSPSGEYTQARTDVLAIDNLGRVTRAQQGNDSFRLDDDLCIDIAYATPITGLPRMLDAKSSRKIWDCGGDYGPGAVLAQETWQLDGLPAGSVTNGFVTQHTRERRAMDTGALLDTVPGFAASYDGVGNVTELSQTREDGTVRRLSLTYDDFGLEPVFSSISSGSMKVETLIRRDPVTLEALGARDSTGAERGATYDGLGRTVYSTVTPAGGQEGVIAAFKYVGFEGGATSGRKIEQTVFTDLVPVKDVTTATGQVSTTLLDELGRTRRTEVSLGADYAGEKIISGSRTYDSTGRLAYEADPFPASQNPLTAYGTSHHYTPDGFTTCTVRGHGPQPFTQVTNPAAEVFPTCHTRSIANHEEVISTVTADALLPGSLQENVVRQSTQTAAGRLISRSTWRGAARVEHSTFEYDRLGNTVASTRYASPANATGPVRSSFSYDSFGQLLEWNEPESAPKRAFYDRFGQQTEVSWASAPGAQRQQLRRYDGLGRLIHREERLNGTVEADTSYDYIYDSSQGAPKITPTFQQGRLALTKGPTGQTFYSYDGFGNVDGRVFTDASGEAYVERTTFHADGVPSTLTFYLPDEGHKPEQASYFYDSARRLRTVTFVDPSNTSTRLYEAATVDALGRVRKSYYGNGLTYTASYAETGRRLMTESAVDGIGGSRRFVFSEYDALGRERERRELTNGVLASKTALGYDSLGRLSNVFATNASNQVLQWWNYSYDPLGNLQNMLDVLGNGDAAFSQRPVDKDRVCRIGYGNPGLGSPTPCNVVYDASGSVIEEPTRFGTTRRFDYFGSGSVRSIQDGASRATFRYDPTESNSEVVVQTPTESSATYRYGSLIERRVQWSSGAPSSSLISRRIPGPGGTLASRRGAQGWVYAFSEPRGNRLFADHSGAFVQEVGYQPFGAATSTGATLGSAQYTSHQWNGGPTLEAFGLSHLGARVYDPVIGRFLSRDPVMVARTAASSNPYAFALNDPWNFTDPTGLQSPECYGGECNGGGGGGSDPHGGAGGPSVINEPGLYGKKETPEELYRKISGGRHVGEGFNPRRGLSVIITGLASAVGSVGHFFTDNIPASDRFGRAILLRYLNGDGDWHITGKGDWEDYMRDCRELQHQIFAELLAEVQPAVNKGQPRTYLFSRHVEGGVSTGVESATPSGYGYLHGTNEDVGGFDMRGVYTVTPTQRGFVVAARLLFVWNDIIDPGAGGEDSWGDRLAWLTSLGQRESYRISITWQSSTSIFFDASGAFKDSRRYPGNMEGQGSNRGVGTDIHWGEYRYPTEWQK